MLLDIAKNMNTLINQITNHQPISYDKLKVLKDNRDWPCDDPKCDCHKE